MNKLSVSCCLPNPHMIICGSPSTQRNKRFRTQTYQIQQKELNGSPKNIEIIEDFCSTYTNEFTCWNSRFGSNNWICYAKKVVGVWDGRVWPWRGLPQNEHGTLHLWGPLTSRPDLVACFFNSNVRTDVDQDLPLVPDTDLGFKALLWEPSKTTQAVYNSDWTKILVLQKNKKGTDKKPNHSITHFALLVIFQCSNLPKFINQLIQNKLTYPYSI